MDIVNKDRISPRSKGIIRYYLKCGHRLIVEGGRTDIRDIECPECEPAPRNREQYGYIEVEEDNETACLTI